MRMFGFKPQTIKQDRAQGRLYQPQTRPIIFQEWLTKEVEFFWNKRVLLGRQLIYPQGYKEKEDYRGHLSWKDEISVPALFEDFMAESLGDVSINQFVQHLQRVAGPFRLHYRYLPIRKTGDRRIMVMKRVRFIRFDSLEHYRKR